MVVLLFAGIVEGLKGESSRLHDQGLREDDRHKLGTFSCISSVIQFRSERGHALAHF